MTQEKLVSIFTEALEIEASQVTNDLTYNSIPEWDSIAHMTLVAEIEDQFDIMLDTDDVLDMSSFGKAVEILSKYDIKFE
ncbi:acyl carrier protein [Psychrobacillus psychrodurans]|uniref:Acyl carrier protein n=1 Tax=Psychrobacillus psychrodurans TaxID=126157 RepID=A0A9X3L611_9BACI|nr:acyl carrier protein [Psychrobacillus psychrodurans]MCZ8531807.1 acyl carrier protein [Psychrobacillus psychrodurans]